MQPEFQLSDRRPSSTRATTTAETNYSLTEQGLTGFGLRDGRANGVESDLILPQPDPWWCSISAAASWFANLLIEGFAAYGEAMSPGVFPLQREGSVAQSNIAFLWAIEDVADPFSIPAPPVQAAPRTVRRCSWQRRLIHKTCAIGACAALAGFLALIGWAH